MRSILATGLLGGALLFPFLSWAQGEVAGRPTLSISGEGIVRITAGKITAVQPDRVTVEAWKIAFSVHRMPDTKVFADRVELTFADMQVGDTVDVLGELDATEPLLVHADIVNNRTRTRAYEEEAARLRNRLNELILRVIDIFRKTGRPLPAGLPSPLPAASPVMSPSPAPTLSPEVTVPPAAY